MKTEGTNLLLLTISAFWGSSRSRWAPEGREVSHYVVVIDRFQCSKVPGANIEPIWGRQDPDGPHVGPINFSIRDGYYYLSMPKPT